MSENEKRRNEEEKFEELLIVELDQRLEFGSAYIDSDLEADSNGGCSNGSSCSGTNIDYCSGDNNGCSNYLHCS